jgi:multiple sugar transport system permease protein
MVTSQKPRWPDFSPYLLLAAIIVVAVLFLIVPTIMSLDFALQSYHLAKPDKIHFVGLENFVKIFQDADLRVSIRNSVYILVATIAASLVGSIVFASALNRNFWGRQALLTIVILPWALPPVVNALLWTNIFSPSYGALNGLFLGLGLIQDYQVWTNGTFVTLNLIILVMMWKMLPLLSVVVLAAMQAIPDELYEAAEMDGADTLKKFFYVTLPGILPTLAIVLSIASIAALNIFDEIYVLAGLRTDTRSLALEAYYTAFKFLDLGYGSAIAYVLLFAGAAFSVLYMRNLYKEIQM